MSNINNTSRIITDDMTDEQVLSLYEPALVEAEGFALIEGERIPKYHCHLCGGSGEHDGKRCPCCHGKGWMTFFDKLQHTSYWCVREGKAVPLSFGIPMNALNAQGLRMLKAISTGRKLGQAAK